MSAFYKFKFDSRVFILLFFVQIFLIGVIVYQTSENDISREFPVRFIAKDELKTLNTSQATTKTRNYHILGAPGPPFKPIGNPFETFAAVPVPSLNHTIRCFREGTVSKDGHVNSTFLITEIDENLGVARCKCKVDWHGAECGQPEVLFRSLFAAKSNSVSTARRARNIFYIIRTTVFSLETLELQVMELSDVVDAFVLCFESPTSEERRIGEFFTTRTRSLKSHIGRIFVTIQEEKCVVRDLLSDLEKSLSKQLDDEDLVLFSNQDEILARPAVNYLKWYNENHDLFRFRLKHLVYGFFWQHPRKAILRSVMVKYKLLRDVQLEVLAKEAQMENNSRMPFLVLGDLNHFGGWFCQLCYQPQDTISFLGYEMKREREERDEKKKESRHRSGVIDEEFATKLIANGVNIYELLARQVNFDLAAIPDAGANGPMNLVKLYPSSERHYSPAYLRRSSSSERAHFENILRNSFARWELDVVDDYSYYN